MRYLLILLIIAYTPSLSWGQQNFFSCAFDKKALDHWNLDQDKLRSGSNVINHKKSITERFKNLFKSDANALDKTCLSLIEKAE